MSPRPLSPRSLRVLAAITLGVIVAAVHAHADDSPPPASEAAPADAEAPDEIIVVTGTRAETPLAASPVVTEVVDRRHLEESGAETVADALTGRAGLWLDRGVGGVGVSMQGLGAKYVLVLVDGQRQLGRVDGAIDLERFAVGDVEHIEIVRGPGSALYGADALGGVINIVTRAPHEERAELRVQADHRRATDLGAQIAGGRGRLAGAASAEWRRAGAVDRTPATTSTTIAAYDDARAALAGTARRGDRWRFDAGADYQRRDLRGVDDAATGAIFDRRNLIEIAAGTIRSRWTTERTTAELRLGAGSHRDQYASDQRGAAMLDQYQDTRERLVEAGAQVERRIGDHHRLTGGGEVLGEDLRSPRLSERGDRARAALWLQDEWRAGAAYRALIVPAIRIDADSQFGSHVTPRLALRWDPTDDLALRTSVGRGYRAPGFKELLLRFENPGAGYVVEGNPALRPETSTSVQLGAEWRPRGWAWVAGHVYGNDLRDLITSVTIDDGGGPGPIRFGYGNLGRARTAGAELAATLRRGRLTVELGGAYTHARDLDTGAPLDGVPARRGTAAIRWRDDDQGLTAVAEVAATGSRPYQLGDGLMETAGARLDLRARVARQFGERLELFVGADNLIDAGDDRLDRIAPRTLYAGASVRR